MTKLKFILLLVLSSFSFFGQDTIPKNKEINILNCSPSIIDESKSLIILVNGIRVNNTFLGKINPKKIQDLKVIKRDSSSIFTDNSAEGAIIITIKKKSKRKLKKIYKLYPI